MWSYHEFNKAYSLLDEKDNCQDKSTEKKKPWSKLDLKLCRPPANDYFPF